VVNAVAGAVGAARGSRVDRRATPVAAHPPLARADAGTGTVGRVRRSRIPPKVALAARRAYRRSGVVPAAIGTTPSDTSRGTGDGDVVEASAKERAARGVADTTPDRARRALCREAHDVRFVFGEQERADRG
jgi:hypothetical protein